MLCTKNNPYDANGYSSLTFPPISLQTKLLFCNEYYPIDVFEYHSLVVLSIHSKLKYI